MTDHAISAMDDEYRALCGITPHSVGLAHGWEWRRQDAAMGDPLAWRLIHPDGHAVGEVVLACTSRHDPEFKWISYAGGRTLHGYTDSVYDAQLDLAELLGAREDNR